MLTPGADSDDHYSQPPGHGTPIFGDHLLIAGGNFTNINNVYSLPVSSQQQQVLDILYPHYGPSRIDGRLFHNSHEYEDLRLEKFRHDKVKLRATHILRDVFNDRVERGVSRHESSHIIRNGCSKHVSIAVASRLARERVLLASIILPDSIPLCTRSIVPTFAYQMAQNIPSSAQYMLAAIRQDPGIFERNTETQFKELIEGPLAMAYLRAPIIEKAKFPNIVVIEGNAQQVAPGTAVQRISLTLGMLSVSIITHIGVQNGHIDLKAVKPRLRSFGQMFWNFLLYILWLIWRLAVS